jgi:hypothetical protein
VGVWRNKMNEYTEILGVKEVKPACVLDVDNEVRFLAPVSYLGIIKGNDYRTILELTREVRNNGILKEHNKLAELTGDLFEDYFSEQGFKIDSVHPHDEASVELYLLNDNIKKLSDRLNDENNPHLPHNLSIRIAAQRYTIRATMHYSRSGSGCPPRGIDYLMTTLEAIHREAVESIKLTPRDDEVLISPVDKAATYLDNLMRIYNSLGRNDAQRAKTLLGLAETIRGADTLSTLEDDNRNPIGSKVPRAWYNAEVAHRARRLSSRLRK